MMQVETDGHMLCFTYETPVLARPYFNEIGARAMMALHKENEDSLSFWFEFATRIQDAEVARGRA
jgi:hypothetical protein